MGAMNAMGWLLVEAAGMNDDRLWDLLTEMCDRAGLEGPGVHSLGPGMPRYCLHPTGRPGIEIRENDLTQALITGCAYVAAEHLDDDDMWRRDP